MYENKAFAIQKLQQENNTSYSSPGKLLICSSSSLWRQAWPSGRALDL